MHNIAQLGIITLRYKNNNYLNKPNTYSRLSKLLWILRIILLKILICFFKLFASNAQLLISKVLIFWINYLLIANPLIKLLLNNSFFT